MSEVRPLKAAADTLEICVDVSAWRLSVPSLASVEAVRADSCVELRLWICVVVTSASVVEVRPFSCAPLSARSCVDENESMTSAPFAVLAAEPSVDRAAAVNPPIALSEMALICCVFST